MTRKNKRSKIIPISKAALAALSLLITTLIAFLYGYITADIQLVQNGVNYIVVSELPQRTIRVLSGSIMGTIVIICTLSFGSIVGLAAGFTGIKYNLKHPFKLALVGVIFGVFAEYIGWVSWIYMISEVPLLLYTPSDIFKLMPFLAESGTFRTTNFPVNGIASYCVWSLEALVVIGMSAYISSQFSEYHKMSKR